MARPLIEIRLLRLYRALQHHALRGIHESPERKHRLPAASRSEPSLQVLRQPLPFHPWRDVRVNGDHAESSCSGAGSGAFRPGFQYHSASQIPPRKMANQRLHTTIKWLHTQPWAYRYASTRNRQSSSPENP
jgi:hypothetical protein